MKASGAGACPRIDVYLRKTMRIPRARSPAARKSYPPQGAGGQPKWHFPWPGEEQRKSYPSPRMAPGGAAQKAILPPNGPWRSGAKVTPLPRMAPGGAAQMLFLPPAWPLAWGGVGSNPTVCSGAFWCCAIRCVVLVLQFRPRLWDRGF